MGVSIQTYRVRIGTHNNPSVRVKTEKVQPGTRFNAKWNYKIIITPLLLLGSLSLLVYSCQHDFRMYTSLFKYPTNNAWTHHLNSGVYIVQSCFDIPLSAPPWMFP